MNSSPTAVVPSEVLPPEAGAPRVPVTAKRRRFLWSALPLLGALGVAAFWFMNRESARAEALPEGQAATRVEGATIRLSPAFAERAKISFSRAERSRLTPVIDAVGTVGFNPEHVAAVGARLRGFVTRVHKFEGDSVEAGTVLAVIQSAELGEAQAAVRTLEAEKQAADVNRSREAALLERKLSTAREAEVAAVEAERFEHLLGAARQKVNAWVGAGPASARLGEHELRAPLKGTVVERSVAPGQTVEGEIVAFRVANTENLWVELEVLEKSLPLVAVGDRVELSALATPQKSFEGRVARVGAVIDAETRSAPIRVELGNPGGALRAGQAVNARIHATAGGPRENTLVPSSAITFVDGKPTVFVARGPDAVEVASVELGFSNGTHTEVLSGLAAGSDVVKEGVLALKSELFR